MRNKYFSPQIDNKTIKTALQTPAAMAYPESLLPLKIKMEKKEYRNRLIGMILLTPLVFFTGGVLILRVFQPTLFNFDEIADLIIFTLLFLVLAGLLLATIPRGRKWNNVLRKAARRFYQKMGVEENTGDLKSYLELAPQTQQQISAEEFRQRWDKFNEALKTEVKQLEKATCVVCNREFSGLWAQSAYLFKDFYLNDHQLLFRCPKCDNVYCSACYLKLPDQHTCPKCGKKLGPVGLKTLLTDPKVVHQAYISDLKFEKVGDNLAEVRCDITYSFKYVDILEPRPGGVPRQIDLKERGQLLCHFTNTAVKIADEWRFIAAGPGTLTAL